MTTLNDGTKVVGEESDRAKAGTSVVAATRQVVVLTGASAADIGLMGFMFTDRKRDQDSWNDVG